MYYFLHKMFEMRLRLAQRYPRMKMNRDSPLFLLANGKVLSVWDMGQFVPAILKAMKLPADEYSTYSFRIGGATSLARRGVESWVIQTLGRWQSDAYKIYIRLPNENLAALTLNNQRKQVINDNIFLHHNVAKNELIKSV